MDKDNLGFSSLGALAESHLSQNSGSAIVPDLFGDSGSKKDLLIPDLFGSGTSSQVK